MKRLISYSGGLGSFMAAYLTAQRYEKKNCVLIFTDTKTEDNDLYRFVKETVHFFDIEFVSIADGRNIWEVFQDERFHGNSRIDPCSKILKRNLFRKYVEQHYSPTNASIVFGIGPDEAHRMTTIQSRWQPYPTEAPLIDNSGSSSFMKEQCLDILDSIGIDPPRLYELGFKHNNCGGFCVKAGQKQMKLLLEKVPEVYKWHENEQEATFEIIGSRHGSIKKVIHGEVQYLSLKQFRESLELGDQADMFPQEGCGCFV